MLAENEIDNIELKFTEIDDPGYHNPRQYIDRTYLWLERWGILPSAGGLLDQDRRWVEDIELRSAMKSQVQREYWKTKDEQRNDGSF